MRKYVAYLAVLLYAFALSLFPPAMNGDCLSLAAAATWGEPSPHLIYVGYLMGYLMVGARILLPSVEWFAASLIILNFIAIAVFAHCVVRPREGEAFGWQSVLGAVYLVGYMVLSSIDLYLPWPGCAAMVAGFLLMLRSVDASRRASFAGGLLLFVAGASMRYDSCPVMYPFLGMCFLFFLLTRRWRRLIPVLASLLVVLAVNAGQQYFACVSLWEPAARHEPQNLIFINDTRMRFCDYVDLHDADKEAEYEALGMSLNDKEMLTHFNYALEQRTQPGWWEAIRRVRDRDNGRFPRSLDEACERLGSDSIYRYLYIATPRRYLAIMSLPLLVLSLLPLPRLWDDGRLWVAVAAVGAVIALMLSGRVNQQGMWSVCIVSCGLALGFMPRSLLSSPVSRKGALAFSLAACAGYAFLLAPLWSPLSPRYPNEARTELLHREFAANPACTYVVQWIVWAEDMLPVFSLSTAPYHRSPNAVPMGHWMFLLPSVHQRLQAAGVESDLTVMQHPEYRFVCTHESLREPRLELRYAEEHLGLRLRYVLEKKLDDKLGIYRIEADGAAADGH